MNVGGCPSVNHGCMYIKFMNKIKKNEIRVRTYDIKMIDKHKPIVTFAQGYSTETLNTLVKNMELDCKQYN